MEMLSVFLSYFINVCFDQWAYLALNSTHLVQSEIKDYVLNYPISSVGNRLHYIFNSEPRPFFLPIFSINLSKSP